MCYCIFYHKVLHFNEDGYNENETQSKKYKLSTLFEFPVGGIFEDNVLNHSGSITQYGKVIKERIPIISNTYEGFLKKGDIIRAIDGVEVKKMEDLSEQLSYKSVGQTVTIRFDRGTKEMTVNVTLTVLNE